MLAENHSRFPPQNGTQNILKAKNARPIDVDFWKNERLAQKDQ